MAGACVVDCFHIYQRLKIIKYLQFLLQCLVHFREHNVEIDRITLIYITN